MDEDDSESSGTMKDTATLVTNSGQLKEIHKIRCGAQSAWLRGGKSGFSSAGEDERVFGIRNNIGSH
jgi:hypothetical protein